MGKTYRQRTIEQLAQERPGGPMGKSNKAKRKGDRQHLMDEAWDEYFDGPFTDPFDEYFDEYENH